MKNQSSGETTLRKNLFKIALKVSPGVVLGEKVEFQTPSGEYVFRDNDDKSGIEITCIISSNKLDDAIEAAESFSDGFLSYLSYLSKTSMGRPHVIKGYDITPNITSGEYIQFYYDWELPSYSPCSVRKYDVDKIIFALRNLPKDVFHSAKRAIHWYREAVHSTTHLDKFISFYIAFESLNPFLRDYYGLDFEYHICKNPDCEHKSDFPTLNGMRTHIKNQFPDSNYWRRIRILRNDITHGKVALDEILDEAIELRPIIEECLVKALDLVFKIEGHEFREGISLTSERPVSGNIRIRILGGDLAKLKEEEPDISIELINKKRTGRGVIESDILAVGRIASGYDMDLKLVNCKREGFLVEMDLKRFRLNIEHQ